MGKVISGNLQNGSAGAVSRSTDEVIISLKNAGSVDIPFGAPVFISGDKSGAVGYAIGGSQTFADFLGFAVRAASKTPDTYPNAQDFSSGNPGTQSGVWKAGDVMDVLVRGSLAVLLTGSGKKTGKVYLRKADGVLVTTPGSEGTTIELENVRVRKGQTAPGACAEVAVLRRNIQ